jgi:hypothetical protein
MIFRLSLPIIALLLVAAVMPALADQPLTGTVVDPTGTAVPGLTVTVDPASGSNAASLTTITDASGHFRIEHLPPGRYRVRVEVPESFSPLGVDVNVRAQEPPAAVTLHLQLATVRENVEVTSTEVRPSVDTGANLDTTSISGTELDSLPVLDQNLVGAITQFLDPATLGTGGLTLIVDGVEVNRVGVPKSAVAEIVINDDPYSAESLRPGRNRIEIMTKPGTAKLSGELSLSARDAGLAARNYFAPVKPPERRLASEGMLRGPLGKDTSFLLTFSQQHDDAASIVHALTPGGPIDSSVTAPRTNSEFMIRVTHDVSEKHRLSLQFGQERSANALVGVGGVVLPEAALRNESVEQTAILSARSIFTPSLLNQMQLMIQPSHDRTRSLSNTPAVIVNGAFIGGGGQGDIARTEEGGGFNDIVAFTTKKQVFKGGIQVPNLNRRVWNDQTNQGGTFYFGSLADYQAGRPYAYTVQQGIGRAMFYRREYGAFLQDQITLAPNLHASLGLRYDWQSFFHDNNNVSPRLSIAWSPVKDSRTVIRGGAGVFYDRSGSNPIAAVLLHNGETLRSYTIQNPSYPNPLSGGAGLSGLPVDVTRLAADVQIPWSLQYGSSMEHSLGKKATIVLGYRGSRGYHLFRSVDANNALPPNYTAVPDPRLGRVQEIRTDGHQRTDALELTVKGSAGKWLRGQAQYTLSRGRNDTGGLNSYPSNPFVPLHDEWGPADFDQRHRLNLLATITAGRYGKLGISGRFYSALPYNETLGLDPFHTGFSNTRPIGVGRNSLRGSGISTLDLRWSHELSPLPYARGAEPEISLDAFNVFNHPNFTGYIGNIRSSLFGQPTTVASGRQVQLSARVKFGS